MVTGCHTLPGYLWQWSTAGVCPGIPPFKHLYKNLEETVESILVEFADDNKLEGLLDTPEGRAAAQSNLGRLKKRADASRMKFGSIKHRVWHLGRIKLCQQHGLGTARLGSSTVRGRRWRNSGRKVKWEVQSRCKKKNFTMRTVRQWSRLPPGRVCWLHPRGISRPNSTKPWAYKCTTIIIMFWSVSCTNYIVSMLWVKLLGYIWAKLLVALCCPGKV